LGLSLACRFRFRARVIRGGLKGVYAVSQQARPGFAEEVCGQEEGSPVAVLGDVGALVGAEAGDFASLIVAGPGGCWVNASSAVDGVAEGYGGDAEPVEDAVVVIFGDAAGQFCARGSKTPDAMADDRVRGRPADAGNVRDSDRGYALDQLVSTVVAVVAAGVVFGSARIKLDISTMTTASATRSPIQKREFARIFSDHDFSEVIAMAIAKTTRAMRNFTPKSAWYSG